MVHKIHLAQYLNDGLFDTVGVDLGNIRDIHFLHSLGLLRAR